MCIFCQIVSRDISSNIVYEDDQVMAFLDIEPINEGHTLLITKEHYLDADDMPKELMFHLIEISQNLINAIKKTYKPQGYSIMQNGGKLNDIGHYHMHIFPRYDSDKFGWVCEEREYQCSQQVADNIRENMR